MPQPADFRRSGYELPRVEASGRFVGRSAYWRLYTIENLYRILIHSVLSAQINPDWWAIAVGKPIQDNAQRFREKYLERPWHTTPGSHPIYYTYLWQLNEIIRANIKLVRVLVPDIDNWIARIEQVRLPRDIVSHMNYPSEVDRDRINVIHADMRALIAHLATKGLKVLIP